MAHFVCSNTLRNIDSKFMAHFVCSKVFSSAKICCPEKEFLVTRSDNDGDGDDDGDGDGDVRDNGDNKDNYFLADFFKIVIFLVTFLQILTGKSWTGVFLLSILVVQVARVKVWKNW